MAGLHRRRSSKDEDENMVLIARPMAEDDYDEPLPSPLSIPIPTSASNVSSNHITHNHNTTPSITIPDTLSNGISAHTNKPLSLAPPPHSRTRVHSSPTQHHSRSVSISSVLSGGPPTPGLVPPMPPSAGPFRTTFNGNPAFAGNSPFRSTFGHQPHTASPPLSPGVPRGGPGHTRTRSISAFSPAVASPLSASFQVPSPSSSYPPPNTSISSPTIPTFHQNTLPISFPSSHSASDATGGSNGLNVNGISAAPPSRRHSRLHSRNLSVFFPRPGALPTTTIAEDGAQELEFPTQPGDIEAAAPVSNIPSAGSSVNFSGSRRAMSHQGHVRPPITPLGAGFHFGGGVPGSGTGEEENGGFPAPEVVARSHSTGAPTSSSRRGHHHKHSLSHSFFSFLEPGANGAVNPSGVALPQELHTQPTPVPLSPWAPISAFPQSAGVPGSGTGTGGAGFPPHTPVTSSSVRPFDDASSSSSSTDHAHSHSHSHHAHTHTHHHGHEQVPGSSPTATLIVAGAQFMLGAALWVCGQQSGALSATGLGYWVVFDAIGVAIGGGAAMHFLTKSSRGGSEKGSVRRPYGSAPLHTLLLFAQSVYLMFASVYVCKETLEHILLTAGASATGISEGDGHHHHRGDEDGGGIEFPLLIALASVLSIFCTSRVYANHSGLVRVTKTRIPPIRILLRRFISLLSTSRSRSQSHENDYGHEQGSEQDPIAMSLSNPFTLAPLVFGLGIAGVGLGIDGSLHRPADLLLAGFVTIVTFNLAYKACTVLGSVLLQTAPPRSEAGKNSGIAVGTGKMERFLRVMREVERHPQVVHLPAPHIWQLLPPSFSSPITSGSGKDFARASAGEGGTLVVTIELHVRHDLGDDDVLELTKWAWEKCASALGGGSGSRGSDGISQGVEVTVGVVRG